jgi:GAF domain-containing protein
VLQLINALHPSPARSCLRDSDRQLAESLASQAAIALTNRQLI